MKRYASISIPLVLLLIFTSTSFAQNADPGKSNSAPAEAAKPIPAAPAITAESTPKELAAAALAAQGGDKFKNLKSMYLFGSANLFAPNSSQSIPGKFVMVTAGDKVRIDIDASPAFKFKQVFDGQQSYSSMPGVTMPPASKFGLSVLARYDQPGIYRFSFAKRKEAARISHRRFRGKYDGLLYRSRHGAGDKIPDPLRRPFVWDREFKIH
jgi:hypothetical protein